MSRQTTTRVRSWVAVGSLIVPVAVIAVTQMAFAGPLPANCTPANPAVGATVTCSFTTGGTFTVPDGVTSLHFVASGAAGGTGATVGTNAGGAGGAGATVTEDESVTSGQVISISVGSHGADGPAGTGGSVSNGKGKGGAGATGGAGGGGASVVTTNATIIVVAGGGGGGGGGTTAAGATGGTGGNAAATGTAAGGAGTVGGAGTAGAAGAAGVLADAIAATVPPGGGGGGGAAPGGAGTGTGGGGGAASFADQAAATFATGIGPDGAVKISFVNAAPPSATSATPCASDSPNVGDGNNGFGNFGHGNEGNCNIGDGNQTDNNIGNGNANHLPEDDPGPD